MFTVLICQTFHYRILIGHMWQNKDGDQMIYIANKIKCCNNKWQMNLNVYFYEQILSCKVDYSCFGEKKT